MDARELEEIMSMAAAAAAEYGLSDFLRDVSAVAGCNRQTALRHTTESGQVALPKWPKKDLSLSNQY